MHRIKAVGRGVEGIEEEEEEEEEEDVDGGQKISHREILHARTRYRIRISDGPVKGISHRRDQPSGSSR